MGFTTTHLGSIVSDLVSSITFVPSSLRYQTSLVHTSICSVQQLRYIEGPEMRL